MTSDPARRRGLLSAYRDDEPLVKARLVRPEDFGSASTGAARLRCWLAGTGTPAVIDGRHGPSTVISAGDDVVMVDTGNGCAYQLLRLGWQPQDVTHVLITHHHLDHNVDLGFLLMAPWVHGTQRRPPVVIGPPGTEQFLNRVFAAHDYDVRSRMPHGYSLDALGVSVVEVHHGTTLHFGRWQVTAVEVEHSPVEDAFGFVIRSGSRSIAISGDTRPCERLIEAAQGADLLIHEALFPGWGIPDYHTSVHDVGRVAQEAGVTSLALTHLIPGHLPDTAWAEIVRRDYTGELMVGRDLLPVCDLI
ncbi:MBL fold metallo-hydrolase [Blastococcus deserti]|uniref:MBL fold metallo-hydrolase n=1 Tax=Blastococcus deserti TaxID=2259033 RepID=A0ABW4XE13_9ACTN